METTNNPWSILDYALNSKKDTTTTLSPSEKLSMKQNPNYPNTFGNSKEAILHSKLHGRLCKRPQDTATSQNDVAFVWLKNSKYVISKIKIGY